MLTGDRENGRLSQCLEVVRVGGRRQLNSILAAARMHARVSVPARVRPELTSFTMGWRRSGQTRRCCSARATASHSHRKWIDFLQAHVELTFFAQPKLNFSSARGPRNLAAGAVVAEVKPIRIPPAVFVMFRAMVLKTVKQVAACLSAQSAHCRAESSG